MTCLSAWLGVPHDAAGIITSSCVLLQQDVQQARVFPHMRGTTGAAVHN
jgi:hypothetical protein